MSKLLNFLWDLLLIAYPFIIHIPHLKLSWAFVNSSACVPGKITLMRLRAEGMLLWLYHNYFLHLTSKDARSGSVKELRICWEPVEAITGGLHSHPPMSTAWGSCKVRPPNFLRVKFVQNVTTNFSMCQSLCKFDHCIFMRAALGKIKQNWLNFGALGINVQNYKRNCHFLECFKFDGKLNQFGGIECCVQSKLANGGDISCSNSLEKFS